MNNRISKVEVDYDSDGNLQDVTFWFVGSDEPWSEREFVPNSFTRHRLEMIIEHISEYDE